MENSRYAIANRIELTFDRDKIDRDFSIFAITTDEKYIKKGAALLDDPNGELKAVSLVFDYGRLAWIMFRKSSNITNVNILRFIERDEENKGHFTVIQKSAYDLNKDYLLFRLFLYSLNLEKKEKYAFNNLTGKLFVSSENWVSSRDNEIRALQIDVDWMMNLSASFTTFSRLSKLRKYKVDVVGMPRYIWSGNEYMFKRTFDNDINDEDIFIHTSISKKKKPHLNFYDFREDKRKNTKVYYLYSTLNELNNRYSNYFKIPPHFAYLEAEVDTQELNDKRYMDKVVAHFVGENTLSIRFINMCEPENDYLLEILKKDLAKILQDENGVVADMTIGHRIMNIPNVCYIVLHHDADYYKRNKLDDPYQTLKRYSMPIQSITLEDSKELIEKDDEKKNDKEAFYKTILKELVIKNDLISNNEITMDDWKKLSFQKNWVFGIEQDDIRYMMIIFPDGCFRIYKDSEFGLLDYHCEYEEVNKAAKILRESRDKTKSVVVDQNGNTLLIYRSGMIVMPKEQILELKGGSHKHAILEEYFTGGYGTTIYKQGNLSYYSSGIKRDSNVNVPNGTTIYSVKVVDGESIIKELLNTFNVRFVRLENFTVLPYPFKYVREYAEMKTKK